VTQKLEQIEVSSRPEPISGKRGATIIGPTNPSREAENPDLLVPPRVDHGTVANLRWSFADSHMHLSEGGWGRQTTIRELPIATEVAGVNMRLTPGGVREMHWHKAAEWAYMIKGRARITAIDQEGRTFQDDVGEGDLWYFAAGIPHSIQGLEDDGCEFLLVFDEGMFSEDNTFLISEWVAHTPDPVMSQNFNLDTSVLAKLPKEQLYIFPGAIPPSLAQDRAAIGGKSVESPYRYTFHLESMTPTKKTAGGEVRIADSKNFIVSKNIAAGLVTVKPGGLRELHWHPNASEWQFYMAGKGRMTVFMPDGRARTMDFNANDVGFVPKMAGHFVQNLGDTDLVFLEMFKADQFMDFSLNNWIRRMPPEMATAHLHLDTASLSRIPSEKQEIIAG
jgi:oxalate decarboxylase